MQELPMRSVVNLRDFGGTRTKDGKIIRSGLFLRSAALNRLSKKDASALRDAYGLRTVIDLRTQTEREQKPDTAIPGVETISVPIFSEAEMGVTHEKEIDRRQLLSMLPDLKELYVRMVTDPACVDQLRMIFRLITEPRDGAILWHCTAGKDRCGIVSALLMRLLDVPQDTIEADYLATNDALKRTADRYYALVLLMTRDRKAARRVRELYRADECCLRAAFEAIDARYGCTETFLREQLELTDARIRALRERALNNGTESPSIH